MRRTLEIPTPENVNVEYELAGPGSRFAALLIDHVIQALLMLLILACALIGGLNLWSVAAGAGSVVIALGIVLLFIILFGYFIFFELAMNGQTPGKKLFGLRVVKSTGEPAGFFDSFLRNILRIADMLPAFNLAGAALMLFSREYRRIGDFAANTVVVKTAREEAPLTLEKLIDAARGESDGERKPNIYPVTNFEYSVLKEFLERKDRLGERRPVFVFHLNRYFMKKFGMENPASDPYEFFEEIVRMNSGL